MSESLRLTQAESVALVPFVVDRLAKTHGIRVLLIKGPILAQQGLRSPRQSSDVDVLCDPNSLDQFCDVLQSHGWQVFNESPVAPQVYRKHAVTLIHEQWTCNLDLHHWYPGMYADAQDSFEALWIRRSTGIAAEQEVICPDVVGSALINGLHLLRSPELALTETDLDHVVAAVQERGLQADLAELASATGANEVLAPLLQRIGVAVQSGPPMSLADRRDWTMQTTQAPLALWLEEVRRASWSQRPGVVWRALTFDDTQFWRGDVSTQRSTSATSKVIARRLVRLAEHLAKMLNATRSSRGSR